MNCVNCQKNDEEVTLVEVPHLLQDGLPRLRPARVRPGLLQPALRPPVLLRRRRRDEVMSFPYERPRRLRRTERLRAMVRETTRLARQPDLPAVRGPRRGRCAARSRRCPAASTSRSTRSAREAEEVEKLGIGGVILFGLPSAKDPVGSEGYADDGVVQQAVRAIRAACRELLVVTDVCLCEYTSHGHCGVVEDGEVQNDPTLGAARADGRLAREGGRPRRRPLGHDGRPRGRDPRGARRGGLRGAPDPLLRRQVRLGLLRALPRGGRLGPAVRRPPRLPDGPRQRARGAARGARSTSRRAPTS